MTGLFAEPRAVAAAACLVPWGEVGAGLPGSAPATLPGVPGFMASHFNPLVNEVVRRCLGDPAIADASGPGTAIVLGTVLGDTTTTDLASERLAGGRVHNPLLFYQSVPTSILGFVTRDYGITGPVSCISTRDGLTEELLAAADLLLVDEDIHQVLVIAVELAANPRTGRVYDQLAAEGSRARAPEGDVAVSLLLRRVPETGVGPVVTIEASTGQVAGAADPALDAFGHLRGLVALCAAAGRVGHSAEVQVYDSDFPAAAFVLRRVEGGAGRSTVRSAGASDERSW